MKILHATLLASALNCDSLFVQVKAFLKPHSFLVGRAYYTHISHNLIDSCRHCSSNDGDNITTLNPKEQTTQNIVLGRKAILRSSLLATLIGLVPQDALAERTLGTITESYQRYVPRMEAGFEFLANDVKTLIEDGNVKELESELTAEKGTKISALKGTMKIFATAFSDSVLSSTTRELQLADFKTRESLDSLLQAVKGGDMVKALKAHGEAVYYAQIYSELANASIPRSLSLIKGPLGAKKRLEERDSTVTGAF